MALRKLSERRLRRAALQEQEPTYSFYVPSMTGPGIRRESLETEEGRRNASELARQLFEDAAAIARSTA
jgi:hypothetical protein